MFVPDFYDRYPLASMWAVGILILTYSSWVLERLLG